MNGTLIDFHAHILPGADHGSDSLETSLWQMAEAERIGISTIVATPHFYPDRNSGVGRFLQRRQRSFELLREGYFGAVQILPGAEVLLCEGLENLPGLEELCIRGTRTLLVEMPTAPWSPRLRDTLFALERDRGFRVVLAHVDRYPRRWVESLLERGFHGQLNCGSICGFFSGQSLLSLARTPAIVAIGSDIHGREKAYSRFSRAVRRLGGAAETIMERSTLLVKQS